MVAITFNGVVYHAIEQFVAIVDDAIFSSLLDDKHVGLCCVFDIVVYEWDKNFILTIDNTVFIFFLSNEVIASFDVLYAVVFKRKYNLLLQWVERRYQSSFREIEITGVSFAVVIVERSDNAIGIQTVTT